jgi:AraC-like DNA-binding protein
MLSLLSHHNCTLPSLGCAPETHIVLSGIVRHGIREIYLDFRGFFLYLDAMKHFDEERQEFAPYGLTCEIWEPVRMPRSDRHDEIELNLLADGELTYLLGGERVTVHAGEIAAFWGGLPHQIVDFHDVPYYYVLTIPLNWVLGWGLPETLLSELFRGRPVFDSGIRAEREIQAFQQWHEDLETDPMGLREIVLLEVRARLLRFGRTVSIGNRGQSTSSFSNREHDVAGKVESMACFVARNYQSRIQLDDIARAVGLHPDYAATLFRKTLGITLIALVTQHRVAHAQHLLVTSDDPILQIAFDSGFDSVSRFYKAFREIAGLTPRQYRQRCRTHRI